MSWCIVALGAKDQLVSILRIANKELRDEESVIWELGPDIAGDPPEPIMWFESLTEADDLLEKVDPPTREDLIRPDGSLPPLETLWVTAVSKTELDRLLIEQEIQG